MASAFFNTLISVILVSLISFVGALTLFFNRKKIGKVLIYLVGFSAGALLGDAFLHLIPESVEAANGFLPALSIYILTGILFAFIVEKVFHWGHFHHLENKSEKKQKADVRGEKKILGYMNLVGDAMHNFVDGVVIAASYLVSFPVGLATTIEVIFHEIPQELGDFGVLLHSGFTKKN